MHNSPPARTQEVLGVLDQPLPGVFTGPFLPPELCDYIVDEFAGATNWVDAQVTQYLADQDRRVESVLDLSRRRAQRIHFRDLDLRQHPSLLRFLGKVRQDVLPLIRREFGLNVQEMGEAEIVRYPTGGLFSPHSDANVLKPYRAFSVLVYLNDVPKGGSTEFPDLGFSCRLTKGNILIFPSHVVHGGNPVEEGHKYIFVMWVYYPGSVDDYGDMI